jgi:lon-related putative ATP-dependent protease
VINELAVQELRRLCDPETLECCSSQEMDNLDTIVGQDRAVKALRFGLGIKERGFNIYVAGPPGTGRTTAVKRFLEEVASTKPVPDGWCYVNNFRDPYRPRALRLPPGRAKEFQADMKSLVAGAIREIRSAFESEEYAAQKAQAAQAFQRQRDELLTRVNEDAQHEGFALQLTPVGLALIPIKKDGQPLSDEEFIGLKTDAKEMLRQRREKLQTEVEAALRQGRRLEKTAYEELQKLDKDVAMYALSHPVADLKEKYQDLPDIMAHLDAVRDDILDNLAHFREEPGEGESSGSPFRRMDAQAFLSRRYEANLLVDHAGATGAPVTIEPNPTYNNLFGRIEQEAQFGALTTDFTLIREGSLHRANGGYLVIPVEELLRNAFAWEGLKRALANREIGVEDAASQYGFITTKSLKPEPVPLDVKVVLIGQPDVYYLMRAYDEQFGELFKVKADFDTRMDRTDQSVRDYAAFVGTVCENENLKHLTDVALAKVVEHGSRLVEDQEKLSTRFGEIADIIREASYYATQEEAELVSATHVEQAIDERFYRSNLLQERIQEMIDRGIIKINVTESCIGQVNGLSVISLGDISFGQPSRITASIALGREGLMDIEREAKLGGPIHTKGVLILSGYLASKYAQDKPLSLSARLVFEQSYSGVDGDSASSTELYTLLSSLSNLPVKQGIAVTGSVNQKGEVQAIGGVNEKIEGFFEVCRAKGLSGEQGVMIPESNVSNLMLREDVLEAVKKGEFHIWPVRTIDEGIEVLTGVKAGVKQEDGTFEQGSVNYLVNERLRQLAETLMDFSSEAKPEKASE